jgi:hypothetical protein
MQPGTTCCKVTERRQKGNTKILQKTHRKFIQRDFATKEKRHNKVVRPH